MNKIGVNRCFQRNQPTSTRTFDWQKWRNNMDKHKMLTKQLNHAHKQENKLLNQKESILYKEKMKPTLDKLQDKIPVCEIKSQDSFKRESWLSYY